MASDLRQLHQLARLYGAQTSYLDARKQRRKASRESLLSVLSALGAVVDRAGRFEEAIDLRLRETWGRMIEPILVAWEGTTGPIDVRLPERQAEATLRRTLTEESGDTQEQTFDLAGLPSVARVEAGGLRYVAKRLPGFEHLPWGYHRLRVECDGIEADALIVSSPQRAYSPTGTGPASRSWGVFAPLYAVHSRRSLGAGDLADFESLWQWTAGLGGGVVATLPMLATFLAEPLEPSPYSPVSRLFWNEFYIALDKVPELAACTAARELLGSAPVLKEVASWRRAREIDYRRQMALRRRVLELLAEHCFRQRGERWESLQRYAAAHPALDDYARFRAAGERLASVWPQWPERLRQGRIEPGDYDEPAFRYHRYVQWIADEQLSGLAKKLREGGPGLYLDLPLGVHRHGYDVWRHPDLFASGLSGGAPPDAVFTKGQNWDFAPPRPDRLRADGYRYFIAGLRSHLRHAGILRIDHVMGLHRLFCIPAGMPPACGVYVRYPAEEMYAILCLESHRSRSVLVGENLGTVPACVNSAMRRHAVRRTYVVQYELNPNRDRALKTPERQAVASTNTHDMPPFAAYWQGADLDDLHALGLFDDKAIGAEHAKRLAVREALVDRLRSKGDLPGDGSCVENVRDAVARWLAASPAECVVLNLEDLWLETLRQNTPGTTTQRPNWRRKLRHSLETWDALPGLRELLAAVDRLRRGLPDVPVGAFCPPGVRVAIDPTLRGEKSQ